VRVIGITIIFEGAEVRAFPITDAGGSVELAELLPAFCRHVLSDQNLVCCLAGLHDPIHRAGTCVR